MANHADEFLDGAIEGAGQALAVPSREKRLASPERRDGVVGGQVWPYAVKRDGTAEILAAPVPLADGALTVPDRLDGHAVTGIADGAFAGCTELKSVTIPEGVLRVEDEVFFGCAALEEVVLPASLEHIGRHAFTRCPSLVSFKVAPGSTRFAFEYGYLVQWFNDRLCIVKALDAKGDVTFPPGIDSICDGAFSHCEKMTSLVLPEGVRWIGYDAFESCVELTTVTFPKSLRSIETDAFYGCRKLSLVRVAKGESARVREMLEENCSADVRCDFPLEEV